MERKSPAIFGSWKASDAQRIALHSRTVRKAKFTVAHQRQPSSDRTS